MTHEEVCNRFARGEHAFNHRLTSDGVTLMMDQRICLAAREASGRVIVNAVRVRSGAIARSAAKMALLMAKVPTLYVYNARSSATEAELRAAADATDERDRAIAALRERTITARTEG